jgi:hypothetical protein
MDYPSVLMPGDLEAVELKRFGASFRAKGLFDFEVAQLHFPRISPQIWRILDSVNCVVVVIARIERESLACGSFKADVAPPRELRLFVATPARFTTATLFLDARELHQRVCLVHQPTQLSSYPPTLHQLFD